MKAAPAGRPAAKYNNARAPARSTRSTQVTRYATEAEDGERSHARHRAVRRAEVPALIAPVVCGIGFGRVGAVK
jgi:hypothetical protein